MRIQISEHGKETALTGAAALALTSALLHLPPSPPDWTALWSTITALPWDSPVWLLLQTALTLGKKIF